MSSYELTPKQDIAAVRLAAGDRPSEVCKAAGINVRTLGRWQKQALFIQRISQHRVEMNQSVVAGMADLATKCRPILAKLLRDGPPAIQLRTAKLILSMSMDSASHSQAPTAPSTSHARPQKDDPQFRREMGSLLSAIAATEPEGSSLRARWADLDKRG